VLSLIISGCAAHAPLVRLDPTLRAPQCISRVRIFDGRSEQRSEPSDVTLAFGRIESIQPAAPTVDPACLDGEGKTLLPGLIDSHAHVGLGGGLPPWEPRLPDTARHLEMFLFSGVTSVLVASGSEELAEAMELEGSPHVFRASRVVTAKEGHPIPMYKSLLFWPLTSIFIPQGVIEVETDADVVPVITTELASGVDFIKVVYDSMPPGGPHLTQHQLERLIAEARQRGARVVVHAGSAQEAVEATEAGASLLMHVPWEDLLSDDDVRRIAATRVPLVTTRHVFGAIDEVAKGTLRLHPLERRLSDGAGDSFSQRPKDFAPPGFDATFEANLAIYDRNLGQNVKKLFDAGVTLLVGTDAGLPGVFQGASIHRELQTLVELGLPPVEVLRSATSTPARFLDPARHFGVIEPGAVADLLLVEGDPLQDIAATEHIVAAWKSGLRVERRP